jgi:hypothetical protein
VPRARGIIALVEHRVWRWPRPKLCAQPRGCLRNAPQAEDCPVWVRIEIVTPRPERQCESFALGDAFEPEQATNQATVRPTAP